ncbi:hypothetical protein C4556_01440 [Candidatus Parcubacteria bacterium]|nr:MAG: hypothetical protein C4556_01440 [Candidatus Parcubacteria bacterium]
MGFLLRFPGVTSAIGALASWLGLGAAAIGAAYLFSSYLIAAITALLLEIAVRILVIASTIFNFLVERIVIAFGQTLRELQISGGIETVWEVFRDLSNIVIIGMFVFIAISLILGIKGYGERKMIARVLVIAVLMNFSLLFTRIIIDASNFTAYQFYTAAALSNAGGNPELLEQERANGIAGRFLQIMGVGGFLANADVAYDIAENQGATVAATYGLVAIFLVVAVIATLLYASFLIVARGVLLIFLMIVSPLAFASYLMPTYEKSGWKRWWETLLKSAIFFPLLTIFLWASLVLLSNATGGTITIAEFLANPTTPNAWQPIIILLFSVALLFLSIRFASNFSGSIAGWSGAAAATLAPFTLGARFGLAPVLRTWRGRANQRQALGIGEEIEKEKMEAAKARAAGKTYDMTNMSKLIRKQERKEGWAKSDYNVFQTKPAQMFTKGVGVTGLLSGAREKPLGGFAAGAKARSEAAAKAASEKVVITERAAAEKLREEKKSDRNYKLQRDAIEEQRKNSSELLKATREAAQQLSEKHQVAKEEAGRVESEARAAKVQIEEQYQGGAGSISKADRDRLIREQDDRIEGAKKQVQTSESQITEIESRTKDLEKTFNKAVGELREFDKNVETEISQSARKIAEQSVKNAQEVGARLTSNRFTDYLPRGVRESLDGRTVAKMARSSTKKKAGLGRLKQRIQAEREILDSAGEGSAGNGASEEKK